MDLKEIKFLKTELEREIGILCNKFEEETDTKIDDISIDPLFNFTVHQNIIKLKIHI